jgi:hypothetical protein
MCESCSRRSCRRVETVEVGQHLRDRYGHGYATRGRQSGPESQLDVGALDLFGDREWRRTLLDIVPRDRDRVTAS